MLPSITLLLNHAMFVFTSILPSLTSSRHWYGVPTVPPSLLVHLNPTLSAHSSGTCLWLWLENSCSMLATCCSVLCMDYAVRWWSWCCHGHGYIPDRGGRRSAGLGSYAEGLKLASGGGGGGSQSLKQLTQLWPKCQHCYCSEWAMSENASNDWTGVKGVRSWRRKKHMSPALRERRSHISS